MTISSRSRVALRQVDNEPVLQYGVVVAITLLGALLRFYKLGEWSFWFDEIFNNNRALIHYGDFETIIRTTISHKFMPLSVAASGLAMQYLGLSEWSARLVPTWIGIATIPVMYFLTKRFFGRRAGVIAALLLAVSTWHIYWSQNARFYTSMLLSYNLALFAFYYAVEKDRPVLILFGYVLAYFAISERLVAGWFIIVMPLYLLALAIFPFDKPPGFRLRNIILLLVLPPLAIISIEGLSILTSGVSRFFSSDFLADLEFFFLYRRDDPLRLLSYILFSIGIPLSAFAAFSGIYLVTRKNRTGLFLALSAFVPVMLLIMANPYVFTKDRYIFVTLVSWIMLGAVGVSALFTDTTRNGKVLALGVLAILVLCPLSTDLLYYEVNNGNRRDWRAAFTEIATQARADDKVVTFWPQLSSYYLDNEALDLQDLEIDSVKDADNRTWFVLDSETIFSNWDMKTWVESCGELQDVKYLRTPEDLYLRIYLYDPEVAQIGANRDGYVSHCLGQSHSVESQSR